MNLNDLLKGKGIDPEQVLVFRHRPFEPELNKVLPWLAAEKPDVFNAYQQTQGEKLEKVLSSMSGAGYVASFIGLEAGKAQFVGLYRIGKSKPLTQKQYWKVPAYVELKAFNMRGFIDDRPAILWFGLEPTDFYASWKGKMTIGWPPPERSWWRRAHRNEIPILAVHEESVFDAAMPEWDTINLSWDELSILPARWKTVFAQWRGIYYIYDSSDGKAYVGSAYGANNLMGRWLNYAASGHGGNSQLLKRDPKNFRFSILQRVSPDMSQEDVVSLENSWKQRLHSRKPHGLNDN
jgi:GIY-YIG catalytic domain